MRIYKIILIIAMFTFCAHSFAATCWVGGIRYLIDESNLTASVSPVIYDSDKYKGNIEIPGSIMYKEKEYRVIGIESEAFCRCTGLISVSIPDGVTSIGQRAFVQCTQLSSVTIPNSVITIGGSAFLGCTQLTSITIPNSIKVIESQTFYDCSQLTSISIPNSVTTIRKYSFSNCLNLTKVYIGKNLSYCENASFYHCPNLESIVVDKENVFFNDGKGSNCVIKSSDNSLVIGCIKTVIPNTVKAIAPYAFSGCSNLVSINIPSSVYYISTGAFGDCTNLKSITLHEGLGCIENSAFSNCSKMTEISIPKSVWYIGQQAFFACDQLQKVIIPDIAAWCNINFDGSYDGTNPIDYAHHIYSDENTEIKHLVIPDEVNEIKGYAFRNCTGLQSVVIPGGTVGYEAFLGCTGLESVTFSKKVVNLDSNAFSDCTNLQKVVIYDIASWCEMDIQLDYYLSWAYRRNPISYAHHIYDGNDHEIKHLIIPNSVTYIGGCTFFGCLGLSSVTIPNSVKRIGYNSFNSCICDVICLSEVPPTAYSNSFSSNMTAYVPANSVEDYKEAEGWKVMTIKSYDDFLLRHKADVNSDKDVDISDIVAIINTIAGDDTFVNNADVNGDGNVDISDVVAVINTIALTPSSE